MRTVVKTIFRSISASAATNAVILESQSRSDIPLHWKRKDSMITDNFSFPISTKALDVNRNIQMKVNADSLSPIYKLSNYEESTFEELQDKECDYYPNNAVRGDNNVLKMDIKCNISEQNVNSNNIIYSLKNIRFANSIVFKQDSDVFLTTANYIQRLLHIKAVKKDLMPFISAAMYDLALEYKTGKALDKADVALLFYLTSIPINHIEDFLRMKGLLLTHLNNDLESIIITDYLQLILKVDFHYCMENLPDSHNQLIEIACVLASSCELTHFSLACQAISIINVAARHVSFDRSFSNQFSSVITMFPMIFVSPVRLHQFAKLDNLSEEHVKECAECIVRFFSKYYENCRPISAVKKRSLTRHFNMENSSHLVTVVEEDEGLFILRNEENLNIVELIDKLNKVTITFNGKQKQRRKKLKKKLGRQLKKYDRNKIERASIKGLVNNDDDSAISSANITSPTPSPLTF